VNVFAQIASLLLLVNCMREFAAVKQIFVNVTWPAVMVMVNVMHWFWRIYHRRSRRRRERTGAGGTPLCQLLRFLLYNLRYQI